MENPEDLKFIGTSALFRNLQPDETAAVIVRLQPANFARGIRIMEQGTWHGTLYIIGSGRVSIVLQEEVINAQDAQTGRQSGKGEAVIARLGIGECFGEMSLITGEPPSTSVRAEEDTQAWALTQTDFLTLVGSCPTLLHNINTILSQRLARTNQQILLKQNAERIWLASLDDTTSPIERSLIIHIAAALATRSQKRVLLLECCDQNEAIGTHFARYPGQARPSLAACAREHSLLQAHHAPTTSAEGIYYPAIASLTDTNTFAHPDSHSESDAVDALSSLPDLASCYEYILLATNPTAPPALVQAISQACTRCIALIPAAHASTAHDLGTLTNTSTTIFVSHVTERPTIGQMDHYSSLLNAPVTRLLSADSGLLAQCWEKNKWLYEASDEAVITRGVDFVARYVAGQTVGIAFGGGGARGFAHLGVLERLLARGVPLDYIAACSSGIITPGMFLIGKSFEESEEIFLQIQSRIGQWRIPRTSLFSNRGLKQMLQDLCGELRFEDLTTPFAMVAVDLSTRAGVVLDRGPLWQAGLASVALPGIFPPVVIGEHILMDAGMHDPVPVRLTRKMGADILIASELGGQEPPSLASATPWLAESAAAGKKVSSPHIVDLLLRSYDLAMATIGMHSIREADVVIRPTLHHVPLQQFSQGRKFVAAGREAVEQELPSLRRFLPWVE